MEKGSEERTAWLAQASQVALPGQLLLGLAALHLSRSGPVLPEPVNRTHSALEAGSGCRRAFSSWSGVKDFIKLPSVLDSVLLVGKTRRPWEIFQRPLSYSLHSWVCCSTDLKTFLVLTHCDGSNDCLVTGRHGFSSLP